MTDPTTTRKIWKHGEPESFKGQLVELIRAYKWGLGNPKWKKVRDGMDETGIQSEAAYKLIQFGRFSAGQAKLKRIQLQEITLRNASIENEAELLEKLDTLGIDREWKTNDPDDPMPKLLFHFFMGAELKPATLDLTAEEI